MSNNKDFKVKNGIQPTVYHEGLGTVVSGSEGYSLANASYDGVSYNNVSEETSILGLFLKSDGTKLYAIGAGGDSIYQYSLSTAYDLSTISYDSVALSLNSQDTTPTALHFKSDGTKLYFIGLSSDTVYQYTLSTAWDLSTASYDSVSLSVTSQDTAPYGLSFKNDGTKMYVAGLTNQSIFQYSLSTAWDLSTASYDSVSYNVARNMSEVKFKPDGTEMYISSITEQEIVGFSLSTAWDVSTASYLSETSTSADFPNPRGFDFNSDGTKMIVADNSTDFLYQVSTTLSTATLDLSTGSVFEVTPTSDIQVTLSNPADSGTVSGATLLLDGAATNTYDIANAVYDSVSFSVSTQTNTMEGFRFGDSGSKVYIASASDATIYQYTLSTSYDISTASYASKSFLASSQSANSYAVDFKTDGTKMYILGLTNDTVYQYTLSTAWDVSTASYDSVSFSVNSQEATPTHVEFKADGTSFYIVGIGSDTVYQYDMTTAWDLSTASYASKSMSTGLTNPYHFTFKPDGTKIFVVEAADIVTQYSLTTAWDISTGSTDSITLDVSSTVTGDVAIQFNGDGTKLVAGGDGVDALHQYSTTSPATITYDTAIEWPSGTAPTSPAVGETDVLAFNTRDGGTTYQGVLAIDGAK